jgi:hypothetical protein
MRPGDQHGGGHDPSDTGDLEQLWGVLADQLGDVGPVAGELTVEGADALGKANSFVTTRRGGGIFVPVAPSSDRCDLAGGERLTSIDAEVDRC